MKYLYILFLICYIFVLKGQGIRPDEIIDAPSKGYIMYSENPNGTFNLYPLDELIFDTLGVNSGIKYVDTVYIKEDTILCYLKNEIEYCDTFGVQELTIDSTGRVFTLSITGGNSIKFKDNVNDIDSDTTNEIQILSAVEDTIKLSKDGYILTDSDTTNEIQTLSILNNDLTISKANTITLPVADGSETKVVNGLNVIVSGNGTTATPYIINALTGSDASFIDTLYLTEDSIITWVKNSNTYYDTIRINGTGQNLDIDSLNRVFTLSISDGNSVKFKDNVNDADADPANEIQELSIDSTGRVFTITNSLSGGSVKFLDQTGSASTDQTLSFSTPNLSISGGGGNTVNIEDINYWDKDTHGIRYNNAVGINTASNTSYPFSILGNSYFGGDIYIGTALAEDPSNTKFLSLSGTAGVIEYTTVSATDSQYPDIFNITSGSTGGLLSLSLSNSSITATTDIEESVEDLIGGNVVGGTDISASYDDGTGHTTLSYTGSAGSNYWALNSNHLYPISQSYDVLIGSTNYSAYSNYDLNLLGDFGLYGQMALKRGAGSYSTGSLNQLHTTDGTSDWWKTPSLNLSGDDLAWQLDGATVSSADLGTLNQNFASAYSTTNQTITTTGSYTILNLSSTGIINSGSVSISSSTNKATISETGYYEVSWGLNFYGLTNNVDQLDVIIFKSGTAQSPTTENAMYYQEEQAMSRTKILYIVAGQTISVRAKHYGHNCYVRNYSLTIKKL